MLQRSQVSGVPPVGIRMLLPCDEHRGMVAQHSWNHSRKVYEKHNILPNHSHGPHFSGYLERIDEGIVEFVL